MADKIGIKEQILNGLEGNLVVTEIEKDFKEGTAIICKFIKNGQKGSFRYFWKEGEIGIDYVRDYGEGSNEDIYMDVHEWMDEHFKHKVDISLKYDGKELLIQHG